MKATINFRALTIALFVTLLVGYVLCIAVDPLLGWNMIQAWAPLMPGFTWPLSVAGVLAGLAWIAFYSLYGAALIALPYNYVSRRSNPAGA